MGARIMFVSGAPLGATAGGQRYEQLYMCARSEGYDALFYSPFARENMCDLSTPVDVAIVGFPIDRDDVNARLIIYDVCDDWSDEMVEGVDFSRDHIRWLALSHVITAVSNKLASQIAENYHKPTYIIPNALRVDILDKVNDIIAAPYKTDRPHVYFWGSHYRGQNWWDLNSLYVAAQLLPDIQFSLYLATDRDLFGANLPSNFRVKSSLYGIPFNEIADDIIREKSLNSVGVIPYRACNVAFAADPIKAYEYSALGMTTVVVNSTCMGLDTLGDKLICCYGKDVSALVITTLISLMDKIEQGYMLGVQSRVSLIPTFYARWKSFLDIIASYFRRIGGAPYVPYTPVLK